MTVLAPPHNMALLDGAHVIHLSDTEARLLYALAQQAPGIVAKDALFDAVWPNPDARPASRKIVDIVVHNIRDKFDTKLAGARHLIVSEYGKGVALQGG